MIQNHRVPIKICIRRTDFTDMGRLYTTRAVMIRCIEAAYDEFYNWNIGTTSGCAPREPIASLPLADLIGISLWMMTTELHLCRWIQNACRVVFFFSRRLEYRTPLLFISLSEFPGLVSVPAISVGVHGNLEQTANSYIVQDDTLKSKGRQIPTGSNNAFAVWCFGKMTFLFLGRAIMFHPTGLGSSGSTSRLKQRSQIPMTWAFGQLKRL